MMNRRTFLGSLAAAVAAPLMPSLPKAITPLQQVLEPVGQLAVPVQEVWKFNGFPVIASDFVPRDRIYALNGKLFLPPDLMLDMPRHSGVITAISDDGNA